MHALFLLPVLLVADPAPLMPTGSSSDFQATAYRVEELIGASKFAEAKVLLDRLPSLAVTLQWDDSSVPLELRGSFADAREAAVADWTKAIPGLSVRLVDKGLIKVSFKESLPPPSGSVKPSGAVFFASDSPSEPRIEAVVALTRDVPALSIDKRHVQNEVGYALGAYLGLGRLPRPVGYMGRMDSLNLLQLRVNPREIALVKENLAFVQVLRDAIDKKVALVPTKPSMFVNPAVLTKDQVHQGDPQEFSLEVANRGNAPLTLSMFTECSCVHVAVPSQIEPGQSGLVRVVVDTDQLTGGFDKSFVIFSNDPEQSEKPIPIRFYVTPRYRLLKGAPGAIVLDTDGRTSDVYLSVDPARTFKVTSVKLQGLNAAVDFAPWEGSMADPDLGEEERQRVGYKITFLPSPTARVGRVPVTFMMTTDSKAFPTILETVYVQWGIVALPSNISFGEIPKARKESFFYVSRPGKPFKVLKVESGSDAVKVKAEPYKNGDYRVSVVILPTVNVGKLLDTITITTDDPNQPTLTVEIRAVIK